MSKRRERTIVLVQKTLYELRPEYNNIQQEVKKIKRFVLRISELPEIDEKTIIHIQSTIDRVNQLRDMLLYILGSVGLFFDKKIGAMTYCRIFDFYTTVHQTYDELDRWGTILDVYVAKFLGEYDGQ